VRKRNHRWIRQRNSHSCVPVAILNMLKWAGVSITYKNNIRFWKKKVGHTQDGAHIRDYSRIFSKIPNVKLKRKTRPSLEGIDRALSEGNAVLLRSAWEMDGNIHRHILLITGRTEKSLFLTNTFRGHGWFEKSLVKAWYMEEHRLRSGTYPTAWFIKKIQTKSASHN
jgi:hypothetical protein